MLTEASVFIIIIPAVIAFLGLTVYMGDTFNLTRGMREELASRIGKITAISAGLLMVAGFVCAVNGQNVAEDNAELIIGDVVEVVQTSTSSDSNGIAIIDDGTEVELSGLTGVRPGDTIEYKAIQRVSVALFGIPQFVDEYNYYVTRFM